jgi:hypothetical protein
MANPIVNSYLVLDLNLPTYSRTAQFVGEYCSLSPSQQKSFRQALRLFIRSLREWERAGRPGRLVFPGQLRVKKMSGYNCFEMSWDDDGRATWKFGATERAGMAHVDWYRIGDHSIFREPLG